MRFPFPAALAGCLCLALPVQAATSLPLWGSMTGTPLDAQAHAKFAQAVARRGLPSPRRVEIPPLAASPAPGLYRDALTLSPEAPADVVATAFTKAAEAAWASGGEGLSHDELVDLFFRQAVALQKAGDPPAPNGRGPAPSQVAFRRAVGLGLDGVPAAYTGDPRIEAGVAAARAEIEARPRARLAVTARPTAKVFIDGRPAPYPALATDLPMGEHLVRVEELGRLPFVAQVPLTEPELTLGIPATAIRRFPATRAAELARQAQTPFALLGQLRLGDAAEVDLWLIDAETGQRRTAVALPCDGNEDDYFAAVLRLDEEAARTQRTKAPGKGALAPLDLTLPPRKAPEKPAFRENPEGWASAHWPLLTAVGVAVGSALVLGIVVATDKDSTAGR